MVSPETGASMRMEWMERIVAMSSLDEEEEWEELGGGGSSARPAQSEFHSIEFTRPILLLLPE